MNHLEVFPSSLQNKIQNIINFLAPYTSRAYFVGGCVRDIYMSKEIKDIDIEVYDIKPALFEELMQKLGAKGVGKSFFVYKFEELDLALPRLERKVGYGHSGFEVELATSEKEASKRRDFTMNALMMNIFSGEVLDFWDGAEAIKSKTIKMIDKVSFAEDSLRVLRSVQFAARFDFCIEKNTLEVMQNIDISDLSPTRIFWELEKFFKASYLHVGFHYFYELGLHEKIFGLHVNKEEYKKIFTILQHLPKSENRQYLFLYILCGVLKIDVLELLKKVEFPNKYQQTFKYQPYFDKMPSKIQLFEIAMRIPIQKWLGNYLPKVQDFALQEGIYEKCYDGGIKIQDVINDGFKYEAIKIEYEKRVKETIRKRVENE